MEDKKYTIVEVKLKVLKLHFFYVVIIIGISAFAITIVNCANLEDIFNAVSFSSALISIILAILTIVYSYYLNSRSSGQIDTLNKAAQDVSEATNVYNDSALKLHENISQIIEAIKRVEHKTNVLINNNAGNGSSNNSINLSNFNLDGYIDGFIKTSSPLGVILLYACVMAKDHNKPLNLQIIDNNPVTISYCQGFIISTLSTGLISGYADLITNTVTINSYINSSLLEKSTEWINRQADDSYVKKYKQMVDDFFTKV